MDEPETIEVTDAPGRVGGGPSIVAVTVVVVTDGVTPYLRRTLEGVAAQSVVPRSVVLVDVGTHAAEDLPPLLDELFTAGHRPELRHDPRARTFGQAVRGAIAQGESTPWIWLLHDDSAPREDALARLRTAVEIAPSVVVAGCKQLAWSDPTRLLEVGVSTSRFGRRMTMLDDSEVDQGQHDGTEDVLGVGIAGALVRRDVWDELGGPDPALGPYRDGLDLSRRARLAGHRVVVVPGAVVLHAQASLGLDGHRRAGWDSRRAARARREAYLRSQLVGVPAVLVPVVVVLALVSGLTRAVMRLVLKEPHLVLAELAAPVRVLARPDRLVSARATARRTRRLRRSTLRPLEVTWRSVLREQRDRRMAAAEGRRTRTAPSELELRELAALRTRRRAVLLLVLAGALALTAATVGPLLWHVLRGSRLTGGTLTTGVSTIGQLWAAVTSWWVAGGLGNAGPSDPLLAVLVPLTAVVGDTGLAAALLVVGGLVLASLGAWFAAGAATRSTSVRAWAAAAWTASPALLLAIGDARVGAVVAHIGLPWVALGVARSLGVARVDAVESGLVGAQRERPDDESTPDPVPVPRTAEASLAAAAGAALAFAAVGAGAPVLLPAGLLVLLAVGVWRRRARVLWIAVPALVLNGPLLVAAGSGAWRALLADPGRPVAAHAAVVWQQLLGWPAQGSAADWFTALLGAPLAGPWRLLPFAATGVVAFLALLALGRRPPHVRVVRFGWVVAALGGVVALVLSRFPVAVAPGSPTLADGVSAGSTLDPTTGTAGVLTAAWSGPGASLVLLGVLLAAVLGAAGARPALSRTTFGWRQLSAGVLVLLAWAGPTAVLGGWIATVRHDGTALTLVDGPTVPAAGAQLEQSPGQSRVLVLSPSADGSVDASLLRGDGRLLIDQSRAVTARAVTGGPFDPVVAGQDAATTELVTAVADLTAGVGDGAGEAGALAIGGILVPQATTGAVSAGSAPVRELVGVLDATPGIERVTQTAAGTFWRVAPTDGVTAWARLTTPGEAGTVLGPLPSSERSVDTHLASSTADRAIVLAERADPGWRAWLDGRPLRSVATTWRQAFDVGPDGGHLVVAYRPPARGGWLAAQLIVLVATVLLAVPVRRRRS